MKQAKEASARIVKSAGDTFWGGYAGYFQNPDGHSREEYKAACACPKDSWCREPFPIGGKQ